MQYNFSLGIANYYRIKALHLVGLVAQRLEQRTHNAHEAIWQGLAQERSKAQIACIHAPLANMVPRIVERLDAGNRKPN